MKQLTILITALLLTFAESYSADFTEKIDLSDDNQYVLLLGSNKDFSHNINYVDFSNKNRESATENPAENIELNDESIQSQKVTEANEEDSAEELFDRSAGAMGMGIF